MEWRILSIDEDTRKVELVSATAVHSLYLWGADGYNHAVDILNDMCETLYSNTNGATARSINVEDINAKTTYDYTAYLNYGKITTPVNKKYPNIYIAELGSTANGLSETTDLLGESEGVRNTDGTADFTTFKGYTKGNSLYVTNTFYSYEPEKKLNSSLGINTAPSGLLLLEKNYWVASRCVMSNDTTAGFFIRLMGSWGSLDYKCPIYSNGEKTPSPASVRPVVTLPSDVQLSIAASDTSGSISCWDLIY